MEKQREVIYLLALSLQRSKFLETMQTYDKQTVVIGEKNSEFISELVLCANFDDQILHHIFALPYALIDEVREEYLH